MAAAAALVSPTLSPQPVAEHRPRPPEPFLEAEHRWKKTHFARFSYCNVCRQLLFGIAKQGLACTICGLCVHERCAGIVAAGTCRPTFSVERKKDLHFWVEGNMHLLPDRVGVLCPVCGKATGSVTALHDFRCAWCHVAVHAECRARIEDEPCSFGDLSRIIVPPSCVAAVGPDLLEYRCADEDAAAAASSGKTPLLVFVNRKSGGQQGKRILAEFQKELNPRQVYDLIACGGPGRGIDFMARCPHEWRVLVAGGDGTAGWVLEALRERGVHPPVAVLPLGTGNDLARAYGWGGGYDGEELAPILHRVARADPVGLDRWTLCTEEIDEQGIRQGSEPSNRVVNNYWSIGIDAAVALDFHRRRERDPAAFTSRVGNKLTYVQLSCVELFNPNNRLGESVRLEVDGAEIHLPAIQALIVLNLPSCYGGTNLWGSSLSDFDRDRGFVPISSSDGLLEVVALKNTFEMGQVKTMLALPEKIAQGRRIKITFLTRTPFPCQVDGEPYEQPPAVINISHLERAVLLQDSPK